MNIAKRMILLICLSAAGLLAIGLVGLFQMNTIHEQLDETGTNVVPSLIKLAEAENTFMSLRTQVLYHLLMEDTASLAEQDRTLEHTRQQLETALNGYQAFVSDAKDQQYLNDSKALLAKYLAETAPFLAKSRLNHKQEAVSQMRASQAMPLALQLSKNLKNHIDYNNSLAQQQMQVARRAYQQAIIEVIVLMLVTGLGTILLGWQTYRYTLNHLHKLIDAFTHIEKNLDFTHRLQQLGNDEVSTVGSAFNRLLDKLQNSFRSITTQVQSVSSVAEKMSAASAQMSSASRMQSESAASMAATMEQMTVSINHVADRASEADQLSCQSGSLASAGTQGIETTVKSINHIAQTVREASSHISQLEHNSERVSSVVAVIKDVAEQTNLLALNAAIEAARAGEQGRGFAVVADEVRKLAERTSQSTREISQTISDMQQGAQLAVSSIRTVVGQVESGVSHAEQANQTIQAMGDSAGETVSMVADISKAIREQSSASTSIAQQVETIAQMAEENSAASQSTTNTAQQLARLSAVMFQEVSQYRV